MKKYIYYFLPLLALIFVFKFKIDSYAADYATVIGSSETSSLESASYVYQFIFSTSNGLSVRVPYSFEANAGSGLFENLIVGRTDGTYYFDLDDGTRIFYIANMCFGANSTNGLNYFSSVKFQRYWALSGSNWSSPTVAKQFFILSGLSSDDLDSVDLGELNYSVVDLVGVRQSISLQFNGTSTGLENGDFEVEYAIMDNSYAYDTSFNAITGQITGRSFFDWSDGRDPVTGQPYEMSDPDIGDWFLSGFLVSPNWNNINTDEVTVTNTLIPALTKNYYHKLSDPVNIGSPDIYAFSYPGNISDHMDSYQYRNQLTGYNYMPSYSLYVRPVKDNNVGQWSVVQWYMNQNNEAVVSKTTPSQNSNNMPINNSVQTISQGGDSYNIVNNTYPDGTTDYPVIDPIFSLPEIPSIESGEHDKEDSDILKKLKELIEAMKQFPDFLSRLFEFFKTLLGWLPAWVINIIRFSFLFLFILILVRAVKIIV